MMGTASGYGIIYNYPENLLTQLSEKAIISPFRRGCHSEA